MGLERTCSAAHAVTEDRWHECSWLHVPARLDFDAELQTCCTTGAVSMVSERLASANSTIEAGTYLPVRDRIFIMCESRSRRKRNAPLGRSTRPYSGSGRPRVVCGSAEE